MKRGQKEDKRQEDKRIQKKGNKEMEKIIRKELQDYQKRNLLHCQEDYFCDKRMKL